MKTQVADEGLEDEPVTVVQSCQECLFQLERQESRIRPEHTLPAGTDARVKPNLTF